MSNAGVDVRGCLRASHAAVSLANPCSGLVATVRTQCPPWTAEGFEIATVNDVQGGRVFHTKQKTLHIRTTLVWVTRVTVMAGPVDLALGDDVRSSQSHVNSGVRASPDDASRDGHVTGGRLAVMRSASNSASHGATVSQRESACPVCFRPHAARPSHPCVSSRACRSA